MQKGNVIVGPYNCKSCNFGLINEVQSITKFMLLTELCMMQLVPLAPSNATTPALMCSCQPSL